MRTVSPSTAIAWDGHTRTQARQPTHLSFTRKRTAWPRTSRPSPRPHPSEGYNASQMTICQYVGPPRLLHSVRSDAVKDNRKSVPFRDRTGCQCHSPTTSGSNAPTVSACVPCDSSPCDPGTPTLVAHPQHDTRDGDHSPVAAGYPTSTREPRRLRRARVASHQKGQVSCSAPVRTAADRRFYR